MLMLQFAYVNIKKYANLLSSLGDVTKGISHAIQRLPQRKKKKKKKGYGMNDSFSLLL